VSPPSDRGSRPSSRSPRLRFGLSANTILMLVFTVFPYSGRSRSESSAPQVDWISFWTGLVHASSARVDDRVVFIGFERLFFFPATCSASQSLPPFSDARSLFFILSTPDPDSRPPRGGLFFQRFPPPFLPFFLFTT